MPQARRLSRPFRGNRARPVRTIDGIDALVAEATGSQRVITQRQIARHFEDASPSPAAVDLPWRRPVLQLVHLHPADHRFLHPDLDRFAVVTRTHIRRRSVLTQR